MLIIGIPDGTRPSDCLQDTLSLESVPSRFDMQGFQCELVIGAPSNWRSISLQPTIYKVYADCLLSGYHEPNVSNSSPNDEDPLPPTPPSQVSSTQVSSILPVASFSEELVGLYSCNVGYEIFSRDEASRMECYCNAPIQVLDPTSVVGWVSAGGGEFVPK